MAASSCMLGDPQNIGRDPSDKRDRSRTPRRHIDRLPPGCRNQIDISTRRALIAHQAADKRNPAAIRRPAWNSNLQSVRARLRSTVSRGSVSTLHDRQQRSGRRAVRPTSCSRPEDSPPQKRAACESGDQANSYTCRVAGVTTARMIRSTSTPSTRCISTPSSPITPAHGFIAARAPALRVAFSTNRKPTDFPSGDHASESILPQGASAASIRRSSSTRRNTWSCPVLFRTPWCNSTKTPATAHLATTSAPNSHNWSRPILFQRSFRWRGPDSPHRSDVSGRLPQLLPPTPPSFHLAKSQPSLASLSC